MLGWGYGYVISGRRCLGSSFVAGSILTVEFDFVNSLINTVGETIIENRHRNKYKT